MDLGKIGDQNVEFFKGRPTFFCATKSVQPFKSYDSSKIGKGEKRTRKYEKSHFYSCQHVLVAVSCIFSLLMLTILSRVLPCQLNKPNLSKKNPLTLAKNCQNREKTTFFQHILVKLVFTCSFTLIKRQQRGKWFKENSSEILLAQC